MRNRCTTGRSRRNDTPVSLRPNYQEKPGDRFGPRVRKGDMIRGCRGNCRLARADALDEPVGIHNRRMSRTTGANPARHSSKVDALTFIMPQAGLTIFSSSSVVTGFQSTYGCDGDQTVSHAAAPRIRKCQPVATTPHGRTTGRWGDRRYSSGSRAQRARKARIKKAFKASRTLCLY